MKRNSYADTTAPVLSDGSATYTPGISEKRSGVSTFYGHDRLGSNNLQETSSSTVSYKASYDAFGLVKSSSGSTSSPFGFVGQAGYQTDSNSGLMLLGHRYYDSSTGRFLTRDPIKSGSNWYDYCQNNPLTEVDPSGNSGFDWGGLFGDLVKKILDGLGKPGSGGKPVGGTNAPPGGILYNPVPPGTPLPVTTPNGSQHGTYPILIGKPPFEEIIEDPGPPPHIIIIYWWDHPQPVWHGFSGGPQVPGKSAEPGKVKKVLKQW